MSRAATLLAIYDVEERFLAEFSDNLKNLGSWAMLTPTAMMIRTKETPEDIMEKLQPLIGPKDSLWLVTPSSPWTGYGDPIVDDFIHAELGPDKGDWVPKDWNDELKRRD